MRRSTQKNQGLIQSRATAVSSGPTEFVRLAYGRAKVVASRCDPYRFPRKCNLCGIDHNCYSFIKGSRCHFRREVSAKTKWGRKHMNQSMNSPLSGPRCGLPTLAQWRLDDLAAPELVAELNACPSLDDLVQALFVSLRSAQTASLGRGLRHEADYGRQAVGCARCTRHASLRRCETNFGGRSRRVGVARTRSSNEKSAAL